MIAIRKTKKDIQIFDKRKLYKIPADGLFQIRKLYPHLRGRPIVMGYIGPRGSGKSVGGARMAVLDYMLLGKRVWSNMTIEFAYIKNNSATIKKTETLEKLNLVQLDQTYCDGLLFIEEINMELADAYRSQSNRNIGFSYILQQLRKRQLDICWNAQSENHVDTRLRFQTDIFVKCQDMKLIPGHKHCGTGELSLCKAYDYSGIVTGRVKTNGFIEPFREWTAWNKPWWNVYDSYKMQGIEDETDNGVSDEVEKICQEIRNYLLQTDKMKKPVYEIESKYNLVDKNIRTIVRNHLKNYNVWLDTGRHNYLLVA